MQTNPRILVNLPAKYTQKDTLRYKGGGAWGGLPPSEPPRGRIRPPDRGCHGHPGSTVKSAFGCHGNHGPWTQGHAQDKPNRFGVGPRPMAPPFAGGGRYTRERALRGCISTWVFPGNPPRMAPPLSGLDYVDY